MEKFITDEKTGLRYELIGDYYFIAGDDEPAEENRPIGVWGRRHREYLKENKKAVYSLMKTRNTLNSYLVDINEQAEDMFLRLVNQLAEKEGITETLKAADQMEWVRRMNAIRATAMEIVNNDLIITDARRRGANPCRRSTYIIFSSWRNSLLPP